MTHIATDIAEIDRYERMYQDMQEADLIKELMHANWKLVALHNAIIKSDIAYDEEFNNTALAYVNAAAQLIANNTPRVLPESGWIERKP